MQVAGMLASMSKLCAQCDRIVGTSSMEPLNPCNDIVGNSCQVPSKCVWKTREGYITYKEEQFQFPRKTKMYQLSCKAKNILNCTFMSFNRVHFQHQQCPCTVLFTFSPRPYSNLSSYFSSASLISIPGQSPHWINRWTGVLIKYPCVFVAYPSSPIYRWSNKPTARTAPQPPRQNLDEQPPAQSAQKWPRQRFHHLAQDEGTLLVTGMIWRFDSCEMHIFCAWMSHAYHCLSRFSHASLQFLGRWRWVILCYSTRVSPINSLM